jgi:hypothetical protein
VHEHFSYSMQQDAYIQEYSTNDTLMVLLIKKKLQMCHIELIFITSHNLDVFHSD